MADLFVKLIYKPIKNNAGMQVNEVTLREPRAGDINRSGNPVRVNGDGRHRRQTSARCLI